VNAAWLAAMMGAALAFALLMSLAQAEPGAEQVAAGATVYADYCSNCHGEQLRNMSGGATFDLRRLREADRDRFIAVVLNGKSQMPPWRGVLEAHQVEAIWAYIRATVDRQ
jgi:mono/diheme cytochrome c family protein